MPLHQWNHSESLIKQIEYRIHGKDAEAFIASPDNAPPESMANIPSRLQEEGFTVSPQQLDGKQVLRVTGFRYPSELNSKLEAAGVISGEHTQTETAWEKSQPKKSFVEKVKDNSLQLSGIAYTIGNLAVTGSGIIRKDYAEVGTGTVWLAADALLAACGKDDKDDQANKLFGKLREYLHKEGVEIPRGTALTPDELAKPGGVIEKTGEFLKEHRVDIKNAAEILEPGLTRKIHSKLPLVHVL